jgi:hypothetical protein
MPASLVVQAATGRSSYGPPLVTSTKTMRATLLASATAVHAEQQHGRVLAVADCARARGFSVPLVQEHLLLVRALARAALSLRTAEGHRPQTPAIPETSAWIMLLAGFAELGLLGSLPFHATMPTSFPSFLMEVDVACPPDHWNQAAA